MWRGGMKFSTKRIWRTRKKLKKVKVKIDALSDPQSKLNQLVTFCIGELDFRVEDKEIAKKHLNKFLQELRETGVTEKQINRMIMRATNRYRFGFETPRITHKIKGMLKGDI
uniref:Uncharacterized protein n=1 Tax=viral metagenome TaxID=1070528 RepID=A0A6M3LD40_9ZZZZ